MFGGVKSSGEKADSNLYLLSLGSKEHKWRIVKATGPAPTARYQHTMQFLQSVNLLLIIGGLRIFASNERKKDWTKINKHWSDRILTGSNEN